MYVKNPLAFDDDCDDDLGGGGDDNNDDEDDNWWRVDSKKTIFTKSPCFIPLMHLSPFL